MADGKARILDWLRQRTPQAEAVTHTQASGWEMDDTDGCGCDRLAVSIYYKANGMDRYLEVEGRDLASLWDWMMSDG